MLRTHPSLFELIRKETTNPNPRQASAALLQKAPKGATDAVLFADRHAVHWTVVFIPSSDLPTLTAASRTHFGGKPAVASCPLPTQADQNHQSN